LVVCNVMLWITHQKPHVDRCNSTWLIKRFMDEEAVFQFASKEAKIPKGAIRFTLPKAENNPVKRQENNLWCSRGKVSSERSFKGDSRRLSHPKRT